MGSCARAFRWIERFQRAETGVAAVEFAMILPIMLLLYIGMVEGSTLISMDRKVQSVSGAVGDLVARSNGAIIKDTVDDYVKVAGGIMTPYADDTLEQIISQVYVDDKGEARVKWSMRYVGKERQSLGAHEKEALYLLPDAIVAIAPEQFVIVSEAATTYTPLYGIVFDKAINLYRENFYMPRFGEEIKLN